MADETLKAQDSGDEINPTPEYTEGDADRMPDAENQFEAGINAVAQTSEAAQDSAAVQAWDSTISSAMQAAEAVVEAEGSHDHTHSDTVTLPILGTLTVYGGIYTVVFGALAVLTILEVMLAEIFAEAGAIKITALLGIGIAKSLLVIMYYMHLKDDNPIFGVILAVPLLITLLSILYLLAVPIAAGMGYN